MKLRHGAFLLLGLAGCVTSSTVHPYELAQLDGYQSWQAAAGARPQLTTIDGDKLTVRSDAKLFLHKPGARLGGRFQTISVRDGVFDGRTVDGAQVQVPIEQLTEAQVDQPNPRFTALIIGGAALALVAGALFAFGVGREQSTAVPGRVLRVRGKVVAAPLTAAEGWQRPGPRPDLSGLSPEGRRALAAAWTHGARGEHASVPAFSRLSLTLMSLGAPARLVERAHEAALEEIEHARLSFALASAYAETPIAPGPITELRRAPAVTAMSVAELAEESLIDGCLMEGVSAAAAAASLACARDPAVRDTLAVIAREEASHVALAWDVVGWCCRQGGEDLRWRLLRLGHRKPAAAPPPEQAAHLAAELGAHGWIPPASWCELLERTRTEVASRLALILAESTPATAASPRA
jgi:hypothetical protein